MKYWPLPISWITLLPILLITALSGLHAQDDSSKKSDDKAEKKEDKKTIATITKKCINYPGLFSLYRDSTTGKSYMLLTKDQLDKEYIHFFHVENGSAASGWVKGRYGWESLFKPERRFDHIRFVGQNSSFYYNPTSALSKAADANINKPILYNVKIEVMNEAQDSFLIPVDDLMKSEALAQLKFSPPPGIKIKNPYKLGSLSSSKTSIDRIRNYPKNTDWMVTYVYENPTPTNFGMGTTTDARYNSIQVQHTLVAMPDNDYEVRYDDPRVGYFTKQVTDQTSTDVTPYRDMISRWHLVKKDPAAALSEPVEPITYWMENTTPVELRPIIKKAVESWNIAFEAAGFKNAVVCKQQPDSADWDAGDLRYNVLRWTSAPYTGSAWGPSFVNPRTGQILGTDIMLDYIFVKGRTTYKGLFDVASKSIDELMFEHIDAMALDPHGHGCLHSCEVGLQGQQSYLFGQTMGAAFGYGEEAMGRMLEEYITELLLHEVGHTLGLNHNFKASHLWSPEDINNAEVTSKKGLASSVMDYSAFNITGDPETQGQYITTVPGPYDIWAITYGYQPSLDDAAAEHDRMTRLLSRSTEPELAFANDADDMRWPGKGIDPDVNIWDLSSDVLTYGEQRLALARKTIDKLDSELLQSGQGYDSYRQGYYIAINEAIRALTAINRYVGGVHMHRAMHGQEGATQPLRAVPEAKQKRAMDILAKYAFRPDGLLADADTYQRLVRSRRGFDHWGRTEDPKLHDLTLGIQKSMLAHLMHPTVHRRMTDSQLYGNTYEVDEMLSDLTSAIFDGDATPHTQNMREQLQVIYTKQLINNLKSGRYDETSKAAQFLQLKHIAKRYNKPGKEDAHAQYMHHLIEMALEG